MKNRPLVAIVLATLVLVAAGIFLFTKKSTATTSSPPTSGGYEYFWGKTCPHCKNVADFLESWEGKDKVNIAKYEVYTDAGNARTLGQRAQSCGINSAQVGVPFLYTPEGKCIIGDTPIIDHFKSLGFETNLESTTEGELNE